MTCNVQFVTAELNTFPARRISTLN